MNIDGWSIIEGLSVCHGMAMRLGRAKMHEEQGKRDSKEDRSPAKGSLPQISLPKGGGAISDIGEKFSVDAATGTASLGIPIATTPARSDFYPKLSLSYDSGAGNGPFGLGWD